ncbi:TBC1 domain family member 19 isoform X2 [Pieris rapae]|uniref:TBC1 domain family member 19 isoform X2 n=1 Tax=Pieris rapae TaxID=64459 RepID=UPI001E27B6DE|nr:TBC1 domain family member 19 isoform X2 [Pieris rapae]
MESLKEDAIHHTAMKLAEELKNLSIYKSFYSDVQKLVSSPNVKKEDFKQTLQQAMKEKGLDTKLRNTVFHWVRSQNKQNKLDPLTSLSKASAQWEKRIHKSLNSMCSDLETSLAKVRSQSEQEELSDKWNELSTYNSDLSKYRPVYAPKDFLEVLLTLSGYVPYTKEGEPKWEFAHLPLQVKNLDQLRKIYLEWTNGEPLLGVNPNMPSAVTGFSTIEAERIGLGERVTTLGYAPVIQEYLKKGSPQCLRAKLWAQVLGADVGAQQTAYFNRLKKSVLEVDLMIDKLIFKDVQLTASNDDQYFVFEDLLYQVMLCFSRDSDVLHNLKGSIGNALNVTIKGKQTSADSITVFPPSGIIPFHGFTMYEYV